MRKLKKPLRQPQVVDRQLRVIGDSTPSIHKQVSTIVNAHDKKYIEEYAKAMYNTALMFLDWSWSHAAECYPPELVKMRRDAADLITSLTFLQDFPTSSPASLVQDCSALGVNANRAILFSCCNTAL